VQGQLHEVDVRALTPARLTPLIGEERAAKFELTATSAREFLQGRLVYNVNSTAAGGGVAELLQTLLAYARGAGIDTRWGVIDGNPRFFEITKRIHNHLYGSPGDGGPLGPAERVDYESTLRDNIDGLPSIVRPGDVLVLHDPQTAGLAPALAARGITLVWRCHVGIDQQNEHSALGWEFLRPYLEHVDAFVFSRDAFAPPYVPRDRMVVIEPSIDPFSAKNEPMTRDDAVRILQYVGLLDGGSDKPVVTFSRRDGSPGRIDRHTDILQTGPAPGVDIPVVLQASRWDAMKDMPGVMNAFASHLGEMHDAHLILAGPSVHGVADDPEAAEVLDTCIRQWRTLPHHARSRIHLACVPMTDADEAAAIVNALQLHATVVTQKSIAEGFGLTVAEAMWKARPVVGSAVGGIVDQIVNGETGFLVDDPYDLDEFAYAVSKLLDAPDVAMAMGERGRDRANELFLGDRHLEQWAGLLERFAAQ
jgi:trehalose synthase